MKKAILVCSVLMAAFALRAEYLNWQVKPSVGDSNANDFSYEGAQLGYVKLSDLASGETLADLAAADKTGAVAGKYPASVDMASPVGVDLDALGLEGGASAYAYYIELINSDNSHVAYGEALSYSDLAARGYVSSDLPSIPTVWHGGTFNAVPEPTGALMVLFGMAFLGLKRRKA